MPRYVNLANVQQFAAINLTADPGYDPSDPTIPQAAQIKLVWTGDHGKIFTNVLTGRYAGSFSGTQAQANGILSSLTTGANWTAYAGILASLTVLQNVQIRNIAIKEQPWIQSNAAGVSGAGSGSALPMEVAAVATERTAFVGPANRGRIFLGGFTTTSLGAGNVIAGGSLTIMGNWVSIIAGALASQGYTLCIGNHKRQAYTGVGGKPHPARVAGTIPVTTVTMRDNHWDSQRRRGLK